MVDMKLVIDKQANIGIMPGFTMFNIFFFPLHKIHSQITLWAELQYSQTLPQPVEMGIGVMLL